MDVNNPSLRSRLQSVYAESKQGAPHGTSRGSQLFFARLVTAKAGIAPGSELVQRSRPRLASISSVRLRGRYPPCLATLRHLRTIRRFFTRISSWPSAPRDHSITENLRCMPLACPLWPSSAGERVVHVGAGTGYYTTLLARPWVKKERWMLRD